MHMANDAVPVPKSDLSHQHGLRGALRTSPVLETSNDGSFLAQVSSNPFFTAVGMPGLRRWSYQVAETFPRD